MGPILIPLHWFQPCSSNSPTLLHKAISTSRHCDDTALGAAVWHRSALTSSRLHRCVGVISPFPNISSQRRLKKNILSAFLSSSISLYKQASFSWGKRRPRRRLKAGTWLVSWEIPFPVSQHKEGSGRRKVKELPFPQWLLSVGSWRYWEIF